MPNIAFIHPISLAILLVVAIVASGGCGPPFGSSASALKPVASPDGAMALTPSVNQSRADATKYLCVAFDIHDGTGTLIHSVQSSASDTQKWAIGWFDDKTIVLYSSDIGTSAWKLAEDGTISKLPSPVPTELIDFGKRIKSTKYDG